MGNTAETTFLVDEIVDGDTFGVKGGWTWGDYTGTRVRPTGYDTPERGAPGYEEAKEKLRRLIYNKRVELRNCVRVDRGRLVCQVIFNGKDLAEYFPEYQS